MDAIELQDLNKKYGHTYFKIRENKEGAPWEIVRGTEFTSIEGGHFKVIVAGKGSKKKFVTSKEYEFDFSIPQLGLINYRDTVLLASKFPARQWKRTICKDNFTVFSPLQQILNDIEEYEYSIPAKIHYSFSWKDSDVFELFNNKYYTYNEAVTLLRKGYKLACAISPDWFLCNSYYNESILLWNRNRIVAEIRTEYKKCSIIAKEMQQEILDLINRNKLCLTM